MRTSKSSRNFAFSESSVDVWKEWLSGVQKDRFRPRCLSWYMLLELSAESRIVGAEFCSPLAKALVEKGIEPSIGPANVRRARFGSCQLTPGPLFSSVQFCLWSKAAPLQVTNACGTTSGVRPYFLGCTSSSPRSSELKCPTHFERAQAFPLVMRSKLWRSGEACEL